MSAISLRKPKKKKEKTQKSRFLLTTRFDWSLILCIILLNVFGLIMIYSASYYYAVSAYGFAPTYYLRNQLMFIVIGIVGMFLLAFVRPRFYRNFWVLALVGAIAVILAVRVPGLGHASHGAYRWLKIGGYTIQIAEPVKIFYIVFLAGMISKCSLESKKVPFFIIGTGILISGLLLVLSNNLSTAIIVFGMMYLMLLVNAPSAKGYVIFLVAAFAAAVILVLLIDKALPYDPDENFRITRIRAWLHPTDENFADDEAYQATQGLYAIASGGFFGKGLGKSLLKFRLPEPHNDYILSIIFEELGILGVLILTYLFIYLLYKLFRIYLDARDRFGALVVLGIFFHIAIQVILNYLVILGLFPTTGVTLPFISAGGSAATFTLFELGLALSVARQNEEDRIYSEARKEAEEEDPYLKALIEKRKRERSRRRRTSS